MEFLDYLELKICYQSQNKTITMFWPCRKNGQQDTGRGIRIKNLLHDPEQEGLAR
jgi:hypothetical protein